jgi:hypothetical protein
MVDVATVRRDNAADFVIQQAFYSAEGTIALEHNKVVKYICLRIGI